MELCSILRISINEFLAGEDIGAENVIEKSDSNLIQITKESKKKQKNLNHYKIGSLGCSLQGFGDVSQIPIFVVLIK